MFALTAVITGLLITCFSFCKLSPVPLHRSATLQNTSAKLAQRKDCKGKLLMSPSDPFVTSCGLGAQNCSKIQYFVVRSSTVVFLRLRRSFLSVFSLCLLSVFAVCVFSLSFPSVCFLFVFSVCVFCPCVFCLCFLSVFSVCVFFFCVFSLCFLSVFSICVFSLCVFSLCFLSVCFLSVCFLCVFSL